MCVCYSYSCTLSTLLSAQFVRTLTLPLLVTHYPTHATHTQIEESAKKSVEAATSSSSVLKLYNRWYEKVEGGEGEGEGEKKGLLQRMKGAIQKGNSRPEVCVCEHVMCLYVRVCVWYMYTCNGVSISACGDRV